MIKDKNIAIVAHDAGSANHIIAWLQKGLFKSSSVKICFEGPAEVIYRELNSSFFNQMLTGDFFDGIELLISGTGWASPLEHKAREMALNQNIKTIAVIDHWCNYLERFSRNGQQLLPNEIWVVDAYARKQAQQLFPTIPIVLKTNDYIELQKNKIESIHIDNQKQNTFILFVMEPIREEWGNSSLPGEIQAFNFFVNNINKLEIKGNFTVCIKPHPSDANGKYNELIKIHSSISIKIDESSSLAKLIAGADIVVGCQTYAMVVALAVEKKVISSLPPTAPACLLPHNDIIHLRNFST